MKQLLIQIILIFNITCVFAQSPENFGYQAVMRDASNTLISNTLIGVKISILQGSLSGTLVYAEMQTPTTDVNGIISLVIGNGNIISGVFASIDWSNGPYFIKTETDPNGGTEYTINGVSQLLSVPYALYAKTAESIIGSSAGDYIQNQKDAAQSADFWISGDSKVDGKVYVNGLQTIYIPDQTNFDGTLIIGTGGLKLTNSGPNPIIPPGSFGINNGKQNTFIGSSSGQENTSGNQNTFIGTWSGVKNTIGDQNTFIGMNSGWQNTTGYHSTYVGAWAGQANTTGNRNAFFGTDTGNYNTTGSENSYFGNGACAYGLSGSSNAFFGTLSGLNNNANDNSFFGRSSGYENVTGYSNSFFGQNSGYHNVSGHDNAFFGAQSGFNNTTGNGNVSIGRNSNFNNTTGNFNVSIGSSSGAAITNGSSNIFIGSGAGDGASQKADATNSIAIGNGSYTTSNNQIVLGNSSITETLLKGVVKIGVNTKNITAKGISFGIDQGSIEFIGSNFGLGFGNKIYQSGERALSIAGRTNSNVWTDNFTVLDKGNVGIGYSNGTELDNNKLAVNGNGFFNGTIKLNKLAGVGKRIVVADESGNLAIDMTSYIQNQNTSVQSANIWINGNIKAKQLTVDGGFGVNLNPEWQIGATNGNQFYIYSNILGRDGFSIKNNGNVLINEISDNGVDKLQIKGSVLATTIKKLGGLADDILMADGSTQKINGSFAFGYAIKAINYTLSIGDRTVEVIQPSIMTLPTAEGNAGREYRIINTSTGNVIVNTTSSQTIGNKSTGNASTITLATGETLYVVSNGSIWRKL